MLLFDGPQVVSWGTESFKIPLKFLFKCIVIINKFSENLEIKFCI